MFSTERRYYITLAIFIASVILIPLFIAGLTASPDSSSGYSYRVDTNQWYRTGKETILTSPCDLGLDSPELLASPQVAGDWYLGETVVEDNEYIRKVLFDPEVFHHSDYYNVNGGLLWLAILGSDKRESFHEPAFCYRAAGWTVSEGDHEPVELDSENTIYLKAMTAESPSRLTKHVVLYCYLWKYPESKTGGMGTGLPLIGPLVEKVKYFWGRWQNPFPEYEEGCLRVQVAVPVIDTEAEALEAGKGFVSQLFGAWSLGSTGDL